MSILLEWMGFEIGPLKRRMLAQKTGFWLIAGYLIRGDKSK